jgi:hypothetical protein
MHLVENRRELIMDGEPIERGSHAADARLDLIAKELGCL